MKALIVVDIQNDYFPNGNMELYNAEEVARKAKVLLDKFREKGYPIVHIQHLSLREGATFFLPNTPGANIHKTVEPFKNETVIQKYYPNSFRDTNLLEYLRKSNVSELTICGMMSHMCIDSTTRAAFDLGFKCTVVEDACTTRNLQFKGETLNASTVHASIMAALHGIFANVVSIEDYMI